MEKPKKHYVTAFYKFKNLKAEDLASIKSQLESKAAELKVRGLVILGTEGINSTCSAADSEVLQHWQEWIKLLFQSPDIVFKNSVANKSPFHRFKVKVRKEIVTLGTPHLHPDGKNHHLTPTEWNKVLKEEKDFVLIDTRNWYEYNIGTFKGAVNPKIDVFTEFPKFIEENNYPKDKKMLIFCTGGIRCEKGILSLQDQGYKNVYQLEGGILKYLEEYPNEEFTGECFVFDHRVAVDQKLQPSQQFTLCPHCGQPAKIDITCKRCDTPAQVCDDCLKLDWKKDTCSKNCAYQLELHPDRKGKHQTLPYETESA